MNTNQIKTHLDKTLKETYNNASREALKNRVYTKFMAVGDTAEYTEGFTSREGMDPVKKLGESENLQNMRTYEGYPISFTAEEFGGELVISHKMQIRHKDPTTLFRRINDNRVEQMNSMMNYIEIDAHRVFNDAFDGAVLQTPGSLSIINTAHKWNTSDTTFSNLLAGAALSSAVIDNVEKIGGSFVDARGTPMPLNFSQLWVKKGSKAAIAAKRLFGTGVVPTQIGEANIYEGAKTVIETPWISGNAWDDTCYFFIDPSAQVNPFFLNFTERPTLRSGEIERNLDIVMPVIGSYKMGVRNTPYGIVGSKGA